MSLRGEMFIWDNGKRFQNHFKGGTGTASVRTAYDIQQKFKAFRLNWRSFKIKFYSASTQTCPNCMVIICIECLPQEIIGDVLLQQPLPNKAHKGPDFYGKNIVRCDVNGGDRRPFDGFIHCPDCQPKLPHFWKEFYEKKFINNTIKSN